ncbi:MAG: quinone oxidoreductase [Firmicutes bacterium]|nr:quinone oxidoreductase [Alicyclobacillaceae bacterium]MCL6496521.1 quinone oxidoreductase [Bacillota bacterium]
MRAIQIRQHGGPEVLRPVTLPDPQPGPGQAVVKLGAIGVNFVDIYGRKGWYPTPLPWIPGAEGAGQVVAVGPDVQEVRVGERVAFAMAQAAYAELVAVPAWRLVPIPPQLTDRQAAAAMLQGMTARYLTHLTYPVHPGDYVLVHAGAGGVGLLLLQMAKRLGATVLTTVSTPEKAELARQAGADHVILYTAVDFAREVDAITGGRGVQVVYDAVGQATFDQSLACLASRGYLVLYGQASGPVPPLELGRLAQRSLFLTRPSLAHYTETRQMLLDLAQAVLTDVAQGRLTLRIFETLPLEEAETAHRHLESRLSTGKILLIP